ncbi:toxin-antitoxin system HicB family antitoxin [Streptomyces alfalfae]
MAKTQLNVRVDEDTARAARERALARGISVNRYIEELVKQDAREVGHTFVEAAADFMKQYESVFVEEFGRDREGSRAVRDTPVRALHDATRPFGEDRR